MYDDPDHYRRNPPGTVTLSADADGGWKEGDRLCAEHMTGYCPSCPTCEEVASDRI